MAQNRKVVVFYSWQSDSPKKTNLNAIRDSLKEAAKAVAVSHPDITVVPDEAAVIIDDEGWSRFHGDLLILTVQAGRLHFFRRVVTRPERPFFSRPTGTGPASAEIASASGAASTSVGSSLTSSAIFSSFVKLGMNFG